VQVAEAHFTLNGCPQLTFEKTSTTLDKVCIGANALSAPHHTATPLLPKCLQLTCLPSPLHT